MKLLLPLFLFSTFCFGQVDNPKLRAINQQLDSIENLRSQLLSESEQIKLQLIQTELGKIGYPKNPNKPEEIINHSAYSLNYNENHEQANWVMHMILPDVTTGNESRTNDFREDPLVKTGSAVEKDYFLKRLRPDSTYTYDGFGYDRGHLAPSADFRWSKIAISESYFYSNMSPQLGDFNRFKWAELEGWMRGYVENYETSLAVVTAPILDEKLDKIERGVNKVSIPKYYIKAAFDVKNNRAIGFILPNEKITLPLESFAVSIDSVEEILGYDLFSGIEDDVENKVESSFDIKPWLPNSEKNDVVALPLNRLPKNAINTYKIEVFVNDKKKHTVCGTVVSTKKHNKGHVFINLDKKFPNQIFSITIFGTSIKNFHYQPETYLKDKKVCVTGFISEYNGVPSMVLENERQVKLWNEY
jgi:endonuclease G